MPSSEDAADMMWTATPTEGATLIKVEALISRADGRTERWALDLDAYRDGRFEPAPTLANGESLAIVADYA